MRCFNRRKEKASCNKYQKTYSKSPFLSREIFCYSFFQSYIKILYHQQDFGNIFCIKKPPHLIHCISAVSNSPQMKPLKNHFILGQSSSLVTEQIIYSSKLFRNCTRPKRFIITRFLLYQIYKLRDGRRFFCKLRQILLY